jgi:exodeoxyribonuclease V beta subunit
MSFDVLQRQSVIFGNHFLEASAGTGKTFAIQHLFVRLVIEGVSIDQIAVVTFTRAATRELRIRIRRSLENALNCRVVEEMPDYLRALKEGGEDAWNSALRKIEEALLYFERAQIFTIHGFCHRMLQEFAFEAGSAFNLNHPDQKTHRGLMRQAIQDFLRSGLLPSSYSPRQIEILLKSVQSDLSSLINRVVSLCEKRAEIPSYPTFTESLAHYQRSLNDFPSVNPLLLLEDFNQYAVCYKKMGNPEWEKQLLLMAAHLENKQCSDQEFDELLKAKELFVELFIPDNLKAKAAVPAPGLLRYPGLFELVRRSLVPVVSAARDSTKLLMRLGKDCKEVCAALLEKEEAVAPDTLLQKMEESIQDPIFTAHIQKKYCAAIIDEFQDTDPVQWKIFSQLFLSDNARLRAVYLVGDPKQSIYAFRSADVYTYLQAREKIGEENCFSLNTNFRSTKVLVDALNLLFSTAAGGQWMQLPKLGSALAYSSVIAHHPQRGDPAEGVHFFMAEESPGRERRWPSQKMEEQLFFPFIASEIKNQQYSYNDVVILVKDRYQAMRMQKFFKEREIPSTVKRTQNLFETPAFYYLKQLLQACIEPEDLSRLKSVLGGALVGWDFSLLQKDRVSSEMQQARAELFSLAHCLRNEGFTAFFHRALMSRFGEERQTILERLAAQKDLTLYHDLNQIAELCMAEQFRSKTTPEGLLYFLQKLETKDPEEESSLKKKDSKTENRVTIMTIHMSKGLEFEVVFALGLASRHAVSEEWISVRESGQEKIVPFELDNPACVEAIAETEAEKMRQLYVALTRARRSVYIPLPFDLQRKTIPLGEASPIELFVAHLAGEAVNLQDFTKTIERLKGSTSIFCHTLPRHEIAFDVKKQEEPILLVPPKQLDVSFAYQPLYSFSSLAQKPDEKLHGMQPSDAKNFHTLPAGARTGAILHAILEKVISYRLFAPLQPDKIKQLIQQKISSTHLEDWDTVILEMIMQSLACLNLPSTHLQQEMEFLFSYGDVSLKGFADLVFEKEGKYYLLDWKSNWLGPSSADYTQEKLEAAMRAEDYFLQASIYAKALERYLKIYNRDLADCFGGALYLFLRGPALYHFQPDLSLISTRLASKQ